MRLRNIPGAKDAITESPYVVQNSAEHKGSWNEVFPKDQPLHIEVGMGKGRFLMDMAKLHPEINYSVYPRHFAASRAFPKQISTYSIISESIFCFPSMSDVHNLER